MAKVKMASPMLVQCVFASGSGGSLISYERLVFLLARGSFGGSGLRLKSYKLEGMVPSFKCEGCLSEAVQIGQSLH